MTECLQNAAIHSADDEVASRAVNCLHDNKTRHAFTLVETLLMLFALGVFSLTLLAVLKKDQFSAKVLLAKFSEPRPGTAANVDSPSASGVPATALPRPTSGDLRPSLQIPQVKAKLPAVSSEPAPESAKAGSPASSVKP